LTKIKKTYIIIWNVYIFKKKIKDMADIKKHFSISFLSKKLKIGG